MRTGLTRATSIAAAALLALATAGTAAIAAPAHPFGSHPMAYAAGTIAPDHVSQPAMDQAVRDFYDAWKQAYLREACGPGRWVVATATQPGNLTVSEGHGYGMILAALMAGHDPQAKAIFDGMYAYFRDHPSGITPELMSWNQNKACNDVQGDDTASDGDLDIAFALLLADKQWGSCGAIDYRAAALQTIAAIRAGDVDPSARWVLLGDWADSSSGDFFDSTRSSDFMPDHDRAFLDATGDGAWTTLRQHTEDVVAALQANHSPATGLLPDFVRDPGGAPRPADPFFLEGADDGEYDYNACRDPWRLATDVLVNGAAASASKNAVQAIESWIKTTTGGDPSAIRSGYRLSGAPSPGSDYLSMAFVAPLAVGAMVDPSNQAWLDDLWDLVVATPLADGGYYENTLKLLAMVVMSRNWWSPERVGYGACDPGGNALCQAGATIHDARIDLRGLTLPPGFQSVKLKGSLFFPQGRPSGFPLDGGAQLRIEDLGSGGAAVFDLTSATTPVPGASSGVCDARKDGWRVTPTAIQYRNGSTALDPPACTAGTSNGLRKLKYVAGSPRDLALLAQSQRSTLAGPVIGPVVATLVLGPDASAGAAGACGITPPLACSASGSRLRCE